MADSNRKHHGSSSSRHSTKARDGDSSPRMRRHEDSSADLGSKHKRSHTASRKAHERSGGHMGGSNTQGSTPLLFFAGNAKLKPFVPSTEKRANHSSSSNKHRNGREAGGGYGGSKSELGESMMRKGRKDDFSFLTDDAEVREWEAN